MREPGPPSASLSPSSRAAISSGVTTCLISALRLSACFPASLPQDALSLGAAPARPFDPRPGALTFPTAPGSPLNPTFVHLISNDCASPATRAVHLLKHAERRQASVHFLKQDPGLDSINLFELQQIFCFRFSGARGDAGHSGPEKCLGGGRQAPVQEAESVRFLT